LETLEQAGINKMTASRFEQMSKHPEAVAAAKAEAREAEEIVTRSAVLDKIKEENAALKRRVQELEQTPPQVVTQTVEVVPEDYEQTKKALEDAKYTAARAEKDLQTMRQKYETARDNAEHLAQKIGESTEAAKAERDIQYFTTATHDYIRRYGGHVWAFNEIQNVSETVRGDYIKAIKALDAFAQQMITNIEGGLK
jgi:predicted O-linked N-acetylglucosamine transferase (SPINDLY family)